MKPKISPTSPKNNKNINSDIENYYNQDSEFFNKPQKNRVMNPVLLFFLIVVFSLLSGILGHIIIINYGSSIPLINKLDLYPVPTDSIFYVSDNKDRDTLTDEALNKYAIELSPSIIKIYFLKEVNDELSSIYAPGESIGTGMALTNDGYVITSDQVIDDMEKEYVAITNNLEIYKVNNIIKDSSSDLVFFRIDAKNLQTLDIINSDDIINNQEIILVNVYASGKNPLVKRAIVQEPKFIENNDSQDLISSSEVYSSKILISGMDSELFHNSLAISSNKKSIGIFNFENSTITPFYQVESVLNQVFEQGDPRRPYLGINYLDLTSSLNISKELSQQLDSGALVHDFGENYPSAIEKGSPAEKAGILNDDIITSVNKIKLNHKYKLNEIILDSKPGQTIELNILREGLSKKIIVTLDNIE